MNKLSGEAQSCRRNKQEETAGGKQAAHRGKYQHITWKRAAFVLVQGLSITNV